MMGTAGSISFVAMLAHADIVVQGVIGALVLGSVACWAIIFAKIARILALRRTVAQVEGFSLDPPTAKRAVGDPLLARMVEAMRAEAAADTGPLADLRLRTESALRTIGLREVRAYEGGLPFLATLASTAPFIGLFGTVWGIMHSFTSIAEAQDTSLAAVAPGIAEALLATAVGLGTAIPAVVGYNQIRAAFARCGYRLSVASAALARTAASSRAPQQP